eukprot:Mrub_12020.p1 GENE.Mrub_12020~~Mrub_12020.p1  ORF type:complete len:115 (-),score=11.90 Mrub_12020:41-385(-)
MYGDRNELEFSELRYSDNLTPGRFVHHLVEFISREVFEAILVSYAILMANWCENYIDLNKLYNIGDVSIEFKRTRKRVNRALIICFNKIKWIHAKYKGYSLTCYLYILNLIFKH